MDMMDYRRTQLQATFEGFQASNTPLVSLSDQTYFPAGFTDDKGIYYFIPWLSKTFGLSIPFTIDLFFSSLLILGILIALYCFGSMFRHWISWTVSFAAVLILAKYCFFDVYTCSFIAIACTLPLFLLHQKNDNWTFMSSLAFSGLVIGYCNIMRTHAGTGALLFIMTWILLSQEASILKKAKAILLLIAFTLIPYVHFSHLETRRDQFLKVNNSEYTSISVVHPKWHNIYIGLSYLDNNYGIVWDDMCSSRKVSSIKPDAKYCSKEYEETLRNVCISLTRSDPGFIIKTILLKLLAIVFKIMKFANFGLLLFFYVRPPLRTILPFLVALSFYSLPGLLALPTNAYLTGLLTVSTLLGIYLIGLAVEKYFKSPVKQPNPI